MIYFIDITIIIIGAVKSVYAPEPFDVGRMLQAEITFDGQQIVLKTTGAIDPGTVVCLVLKFSILDSFDINHQYGITFLYLIQISGVTFSKQLLVWEAMWRRLCGSMTRSLMYVIPSICDITNKLPLFFDG